MKSLSSFLSVVLVPLIAVLPIRAQLPPAPSGTEATLQLRMVESSANKFMVEVTDGAAVPAAGAAVAFRLPDSDPAGTFGDGSHAAVVYTDINGRAQVAGIQWNRASGVASVRITAARGAAHAGLIVEQPIAPNVVAVPVTNAVPQPAVAQPAVAPPAVTQPAVTQPGVTQPGVLESPAAKIVQAEPLAIAHSGASTPVAPAPPPSVSVTNTKASPGETVHSSKKWLVVLLVAGAAGAGAAFAFKGKGASAAPAAPSLSIGNPSISIGHP
jgi:hypothetical protein